MTNSNDGVAKDFPHLLSPLQIGARRVRNRILVTGHVPRLAKDNLPSDAYIAYHRERAKGGVGLQITGATGVHATGTLGTHYSLQNLDDGIIPGYRKLADAVHAEGGTILAQLAHSGATLSISDAGRPLMAPSPVPSELAREVPHEMSLTEITDIVAAHGAAATRVREGDMDGVEILAAFGFLVGAFLSPYSNRRHDHYGGSLENRLRFAQEVIEAVRAAVGPDRIVGLRIPGDEGVAGGLTPDDMREIAPRLAISNRLDYFNVIYGTNYDRLGRMKHWPPTPAPHGLFVPLAANIKAVVSLPVFTTGRITDPRMAEAILRDGQADMIGMTRAHIADPAIGRKVAAGLAEDIRPCVGANVCISLSGGPLRCFHNPDVGREETWGQDEPATEPKRVVVIGGGPGGLEAARRAAKRGHAVTLYEASDALGGQLRLWAKAPRAGELKKSLDWFESQLRQHQVRVVLNHRLAAEDVANLEADALIVATGSRPSTDDPLSGHEGANIPVISPQDVLTDPPQGIKRALVWDEGGGHCGLSAAQALAEQGSAVIIATTSFAVGESIDPVVRTPLYQYLLSKGADFRPCERLLRIEARTAVLGNLYSGDESRVDDLDLIVDWRGNRVVDSVSGAAKATGRDVHVIGDCVSPRSVHVAVAEGAMAARRI